MSLARWAGSFSPDAPEPQVLESGERPTSTLARWAEESADPNVALAIERLRGLAKGKSGHVRHPFPVEERPAYKDVVGYEQLIHELLSKASSEEVPIASLVSNGQVHVRPERVAVFVRDPVVANDDGLPIVVRSGGKNVIWNGHHRTTAAHLRGRSTIGARFIDFDAVKGDKP
jgi:hypothetical protein